MIYTYKITKENEWKNFGSVLVIFISTIVIGPLILYFQYPKEDIFTYTYIFPAVFLLFFIPLCMIHLKYYSLNDGMEMIYDSIKNIIEINNKKDDTTSEFKLDDIKYIFHTMTPAFSEKRMYWFPWDSYNYSEIYLKNGMKFTITSLMVLRLELPVGDKYEIMKNLYPYPKS